MVSLGDIVAQLKRMLPGAARIPPSAAMPAPRVPDSGIPLPFRIAVCGIDELAAHREARVSHVLSILDPGWPEPEVFGRFGEHEKLELRFHDVIDSDPRSVAPDPGHIRQLLAFGARLDREPGAHLLVHCHAGILPVVRVDGPAGRAGATGAAVRRGVRRNHADRPQIWPNLRIVELGDEALGRNGDLIAAAHRVYRFQIGKRPELPLRSGRGGAGERWTPRRGRPGRTADGDGNSAAAAEGADK